MLPAMVLHLHRRLAVCVLPVHKPFATGWVALGSFVLLHGVVISIRQSVSPERKTWLRCW